MMFQNPLFITTNTIAGVPATTFTQGQFDLYPSNDYYNLKAEFARKFPKFLKSRVTGVVSLARSQQNDNLIPWAIEPLTAAPSTVSTGQHVEHDRLAEQAVGRCAHRHDARRPRHPPESRRERWREGQGPLLRYRQQQGVRCLQSADGAVGTTAEQRLGRVLRHAEPDRWQQSGRYAEHRLQRHRLRLRRDSGPGSGAERGMFLSAARPTSIAN